MLTLAIQKCVKRIRNFLIYSVKSSSTITLNMSKGYIHAIVVLVILHFFTVFHCEEVVPECHVECENCFLQVTDILLSKYPYYIHTNCDF